MNLLSNLIHIIISVDVSHLVAVVSQNRLSLAVELGQASAELLFGVISTVNQRFTGDIIQSCHLRRTEEGVVGTTTCRVNQSASYSLYQKLIIDVKVDHLVNANILLLQKTIKNLRLIHSSGEAVKNKTLGTGRALDRFSNNSCNNVVTYEHTSVHDGLGFTTHFTSILHGITKHVASGKVAKAILFFNSRSLCSFSSSGRAKKNGALLLLHFTALHSAL
mmetsp:Transcript_120331/g.236486  ORF Transcript_120331/g.236486 Transcript_120331/m.236486 type:complete len:220 (+) Transcript_120331:237-896(+)